MISSMAFVNAATMKGCGQTCAHTDHLSEMTRCDPVFCRTVRKLPQHPQLQFSTLDIALRQEGHVYRCKEEPSPPSVRRAMSVSEG